MKFIHTYIYIFRYGFIYFYILFIIKMDYNTLHILLTAIYMVFITVWLQKSWLTRKGLDLENWIIVIWCYLIRVIVMMSICWYDVF